MEITTIFFSFLEDCINFDDFYDEWKVTLVFTEMEISIDFSPLKASLRELVQQSPGDLVPHPAHVEGDSLVTLTGLADQLRAGAGGGAGPARL